VNETETACGIAGGWLALDRKLSSIRVTVGETNQGDFMLARFHAATGVMGALRTAPGAAFARRT